MHIIVVKKFPGINLERILKTYISFKCIALQYSFLQLQAITLNMAPQR
jgi:hypothetical protein